MILYIGNKHCTSVEQLKEYFSMDLTPESDIYADLLDYGRYGDIASWLRQMGEPDMVSKIDPMSTDLSDSAFYAKLKAMITGSTVIDSDTVILKFPFEKCFSFENVKCDVQDDKAMDSVYLKVLMCVNETYELSVSSNWGTRAELVNPYSHPEGKTACFFFTLRKRPGKNVGEIAIRADGKVLSQPSRSSSSSSFGNETIKDLIKKRVLSQIISALMSAANLH